ncbi:sensor histidine kinase [Luethyella okanaganae]|uniref:histidine kinase n=1 Tax=Luethyella okanaganae TaxID=69372 RepID=A0ABW1VDD8_9MICO
MTISNETDEMTREPIASHAHSLFRGYMGREWLLVIASIVLSSVFYLINLIIGQVTERPWASGGAGVPAVAIALLFMQAVALLWRRRHPLVMFGAVYLVFIAMTLLQGNRDLAAGPTLWIAVFFLAANTNARVAIPTLLVAAGGDVVVQLPWLAQAHELTSALWVVSVAAVVVKVAVVYTICAFLGGWVTLQRRRAELAVERTELIQKESEARVREAVTKERNKMARELHDVAAHHLSGIAVQSRAALHVHPRDPDTVGALLRDIRRQSQDTLISLGQIVGILREGDDQELSPQPMIEDIGELVASTRRLSTVVNLHVEGDSSRLSPAVSLACYRIVQESLSNAHKHASGAEVFVRIQNHDDQVEILVENGRPPSELVATTDLPQGGFGLTGMRERVQVLGGYFEAGSTLNEGWRNKAIIPTQEGTVVR